jgi:DNA-binding XRE family transcriptional regulator
MVLPPDHPLTRWRAVRGLNQQELADAAGIHRNTIQRIELGAAPGVANAIKLARALRTDVEAVFAYTVDGGDSAELLAAEKRRP